MCGHPVELVTSCVTSNLSVVASCDGDGLCDGGVVDGVPVHLVQLVAVVHCCRGLQCKEGKACNGPAARGNLFVVQGSSDIVTKTEQMYEINPIALMEP